MARGYRRQVLTAGAAGLATCLSGCAGITGRGRTGSSEPTADGDDLPDVPECDSASHGDLPDTEPAEEWPQLRADARNTGANLAASGPSLEEIDTIGRDSYILREGGLRGPTVGYGTAYVGSNSETYALPLSSGSPEWSQAPSVAGGTSPIIGGRNLYRQRGSGFEALDPGTGCRRWGYDSGEIAKGIVATDDTVYARTWNEGLHAVAAAEGTQRWHFSEPDEQLRGLAAGESAVYVLTGSTCYALDPTDGTVIWRSRPDLGEESLTRRPVVGDEHIFVITWDTLIALSKSDGSEVWRRLEYAEPFYEPAVTPDRVFVDFEEGDEEGVVAFAPENGTELWRYATDFESVFGPPTVAANGVYVNEQYAVSRLDRETGTRQSRAEVSEWGLGNDLVVVDGGLLGSKPHGEHSSRVFYVGE